MNNKSHPWLRILPLISILAIAVGCSKAPNDAQATSDIQSKLAADSGLQNKQIAVQADKGTLTLSGRVDNDVQREAAAKYAASERGVKTVINNLEVGAMQASAMQASAMQADAEPAPSSAPAAEAARPIRSSKPSPGSKSRHVKLQQQDQMAQSSAPPPASGPQDPAPPPPATASAPPPPPEPQKVTVLSGAVIPIRLVDPIDSATAQVGETFHGTLDAPVAVDGDVVIPAHYDVEGHVVNAQASGKFAGRALLELQLDRIKVGDTYYNVATDHFKQEPGSRGTNTAGKVGGGAI